MSTPARMNVLGFAGSLRKGSYNGGALRAARDLAPEGMAVEIFDIAAIPLYNEDLHRQGFPPAVQAFRDKIRAADGLLIATPEYNYSVPGVLKNAIDWASRPPEQPFADKPIAIMGASPGMFGTVRAQHHLRQCFVFLDGKVLARPEIMIPAAGDKFDDQGNLVDESTRKFIAAFLAAFKTWIGRLKQP